MKCSISNLLLLTALIAALMGWFYDHRRLKTDKDRLNSEAAALFNHLAVAQGSGAFSLPPDKLPPTRSYNFSIEQDRADWVSDRRFPILGHTPYNIDKKRSVSRQ